MRASAVSPGKPDSVHLAGLSKPSVKDVPADGHQFLVIGHEGFGQVEAVGENVTEVRPGDYVVATVRRPGTSLYDLIGTSDMTTDDTYLERGINLRHGYLTEYTIMANALRVADHCARGSGSAGSGRRP
jgi:glucose 1-dehydrogenase